MLAVLVESGSKSRFYPIDVMLIHLRLHLKIAEIVDDSNLLSSLDALSQFHIEQADFARNGAADVQFLLALANQLHILLHGFQIITHLIHL
ncbi:unknown [Prevotella sp. CAG:604]|nr:unknown [Prevotella sp. CAG:604]